MTDPLQPLADAPVVLADPALVRARGAQRTRRGRALLAGAGVLLAVAAAGGVALATGTPERDALVPAAPSATAGSGAPVGPCPELLDACNPSTAPTPTPTPPAVSPPAAPVPPQTRAAPPSATSRPAAPAAPTPAAPRPSTPAPTTAPPAPPRDPVVTVRAMSCCIAESNTFVYEGRGFAPGELEVVIRGEDGTVYERATVDSEDGALGSRAYGPPADERHPSGYLITVTVSDALGSASASWSWRDYHQD